MKKDKNIKKDSNLESIEKRVKKLAIRFWAGILVVFILVLTGILTFSSFYYMNLAFALSGNYTKVTGDSLTASEWNNLAIDFSGGGGGGGGASWVNVPLNDSNLFDPACSYSFNLTAETTTGLPANSLVDRIYSISGVSSKVLIFIAHNNDTSHINSDSKNELRVNGVSLHTVAWIKKMCS